MTTLAKLRFNLFGSNKEASFSHSKTLYNNFISMCTLSFVKTRSQATRKLLSDLQTCELRKGNSIIELNKNDRMHEIAVLELTKLAVTVWEMKRTPSKSAPSLSTRVSFVGKFKTAILAKQTEYVRQDGAASRRELEWVNPQYSQDAMSKYLLTLDDTQIGLYNKLYDEYQSLQNAKSQSHIAKFRSFALLPFINYVFDFDCLNSLFDGCNAFLAILQ